MPAYRRIAFPMLGLARCSCLSSRPVPLGVLVPAEPGSARRPSRPRRAPASAPSARGPAPGCKGADVRSLQRLLVAAPASRSTSTGDYLYATSRAVQRFQVAPRPARQAASPARARSRRCARAARGPHGVEASGGLGFDGDDVDARRLGDRIPLGAGMSGHDVASLQDFLRRAGFSSVGRPDGEFGASTVSAVRRFERAQNRDGRRRLDAGDIDALRTLAGEDAKPGDAGDPPSPARAARPGRQGAPSAPTASRSPPPARPTRSRRSSPRATRSPASPTSTAAATARWEDSGYDCSGSVSYALHGAGLLEQSARLRRLRGWGDAGPGQWVTHLRELRPRLHGRRRPALRHERPRRRTAPAGRPTCARPRLPGPAPGRPVAARASSELPFGASKTQWPHGPHWRPFVVRLVVDRGRRRSALASPTGRACPSGAPPSTPRGARRVARALDGERARRGARSR